MYSPNTHIVLMKSSSITLALEVAFRGHALKVTFAHAVNNIVFHSRSFRTIFHYISGKIAFYAKIGIFIYEMFKK